MLFKGKRQLYPTLVIRFAVQEVADGYSQEPDLFITGFGIPQQSGDVIHDHGRMGNRLRERDTAGDGLEIMVLDFQG